jgi:hypothetical protein
MPALTRRGKRPPPANLEGEDDDVGFVEAVGILAQRAARREAAQAQGPAVNQVRRFMLSHIGYITICSYQPRMTMHDH